MPPDGVALLRRTKPSRWNRPLARRTDTELPFNAAALGRGAAVVLNSTVYIHSLQDRLPPAIDGVLARATVYHSSVARAEIAFSLGSLDPKDSRTAKRRAVLERLLDRMPERRRLAPSDGTCLEAAILCGILARIQGYGGDNRRRLLRDALIFTTARECGATLVSGNVADMDLLSAIRPDAKILLYRSAA